MTKTLTATRPLLRGNKDQENNWNVHGSSEKEKDSSPTLHTLHVP